MLKITNRAVSVLKASAQSKEGVSDDVGIRIRRNAVTHQDGSIRVGLVVCNGPEAGDSELVQDGLRIYVEDALTGPLEGRTLDVQNDEESTRFIFS